MSADHDQLTQALLNLCLNARDAMPEGGILTVATDLATEDDRPGAGSDARTDGYVRIRVMDTGIGMDEATRERVFEPFFTTKELGKGAGIGLAVVYGIVRGHSGHIKVISAPGRGSTFSLYLPVDSQPALLPPPMGRPERSASSRVEGTILLIEDEETLLNAFRTVLEVEGYSVLSARDGPSAIALHEAKADRVDLIVADLGLPGMSGWQAIREIRRRHPGARAIVASGYLEPELKVEMLAHGVTGLLEKPYSVDEVLRKIREALGASSLRAT